MDAGELVDTNADIVQSVILPVARRARAARKETVLIRKSVKENMLSFPTVATTNAFWHQKFRSALVVGIVPMNAGQLVDRDADIVPCAILSVARRARAVRKGTVLIRKSVKEKMLSFLTVATTNAFLQWLPRRYKNKKNRSIPTPMMEQWI